MQDSSKAGYALCRSDYASNFSRKHWLDQTSGDMSVGLASSKVSKDCSHKKGTKMFSSGGIAANQAVKHWKYPVNFTGEMITCCGSFYLLQG